MCGRVQRVAQLACQCCPMANSRKLTLEYIDTSCTVYTYYSSKFKGNWTAVHEISDRCRGVITASNASIGIVIVQTVSSCDVRNEDGVCKLWPT